MLFKIEVNLDWLDEGMNIDEFIKDEIISSIKTKVAADAIIEMTKKLNEVIQQKTTEIVDVFLEKTLANSVENMKIPYKKDSWGSDVQYMALSEFVGKRYEEFLNKKVFDKDGSAPRYESDKKLSINEYLINKYLEKELAAKVSKLIQGARKDAEDSIIKTLEENLKTQLSIDIIKRLNIPNLLKNLQDKAVLLEEATASTTKPK
jgi:hypothetical protein